MTEATNEQRLRDADSRKPEQDLPEEPSSEAISYEEDSHSLPVWARGLLLLLLIALVVFGLTRLQDDHEKHMDLRKLNLPSQAEVSRINVSTNPAYQQKLEAYSERKAEAARQSGESYVAPISQAHRSKGQKPEVHV